MCVSAVKTKLPKCEHQSPSKVSHRLYGRRYMLVYIIALANLVAQVSLAFLPCWCLDGTLLVVCWRLVDIHTGLQ